ncbi:hypothetical protein V5799_016598, partial [Amblyomma americanum]
HRNEHRQAHRKALLRPEVAYQSRHVCHGGYKDGRRVDNNVSGIANERHSLLSADIIFQRDLRSYSRH